MTQKGKRNLGLITVNNQVNNSQPECFLLQNAQKMCRCRLHQRKKCRRRYFPSQNCHFTVRCWPDRGLVFECVTFFIVVSFYGDDRPEAKKRRKPRNGWILSGWSERNGNHPSLHCFALSISKGKISFAQQIWAMRKITTLQWDG